MMGLIVGKNRFEFCKIKKKDVDKHFFISRHQLYKMYPDGLIPMDIFHDGAYVRSESVTMFEENGLCPYHTKYPEQYEQDAILYSIDEHKLLSGKKSKFLTISGFAGSSEFKNILPFLVVGVVLAYAFIAQLIG